MRAIVKAGVRLIIVYLFISLLIYLNTGIGQVVLVDRGFIGANDEDYLTFGIAAIVIATLIAAGILTALWWKTDWLVKGQIAFAISLQDEPGLVVTTSSSVIRQLVTDGTRILIGLGLLFWESQVKRLVSMIRDIPKPQKVDE